MQFKDFLKHELHINQQFMLFIFLWICCRIKLKSDSGESYRFFYGKINKKIKEVFRSMKIIHKKRKHLSRVFIGFVLALSLLVTLPAMIGIYADNEYDTI